jgi:hypothetical protein
VDGIEIVASPFPALLTGPYAGAELSAPARAAASATFAALSAVVSSIGSAVSADVQVFVLVGRTHQHANRDVLVESDLLPVRLRRSGTAIDARGAAPAEQPGTASAPG